MVDVRVSQIASGQFGLFTRPQVLVAGGCDQLIQRRLNARRWVTICPGVYSLPGWPPSWRRDLLAACLEAGPGAAASHQSAAALHRLPTFPEGPVIVSLAHGDHQHLSLGRLRQPTDLRQEHRTVVDGIPVTTVARTLVDLAGCREVSTSRLAVAVDEAHVSSTCRVADVQQMYEELRRPGKRGMRTLAVVLAARGPGYIPPASTLERKTLSVLREGGLPEPVRQYPLPWRADAEGRVDFAYPAARVIIEVDGRRWHARMDQMENDRQRDREAQDHGWRLYRFMWDDITKRPEMVVGTLREALGHLSSK